MTKVNILCAKQCIAFRGHRADINSNQNPDNFLAILKLLAETNDPHARFFSILADEIESHHVKQLLLCIRFVDDKNNIRDEFLEFGVYKQIDGKSIAEEILYILPRY